MKQGMARRSSVLVRSVLKIEEKARGGSCERAAAAVNAYRKVAIEPRRGEENHIVFFRCSVRFLTRFS